MIGNFLSSDYNHRLSDTFFSFLFSLNGHEVRQTLLVVMVVVVELILCMPACIIHKRPAGRPTTINKTTNEIYVPWWCCSCSCCCCCCCLRQNQLVLALVLGVKLPQNLKKNSTTNYRGRYSHPYSSTHTHTHTHTYTKRVEYSMLWQWITVGFKKIHTVLKFFLKRFI